MKQKIDLKDKKKLRKCNKINDADENKKNIYIPVYDCSNCFLSEAEIQGLLHPA
jgi:hypothetical protein